MSWWLLLGMVVASVGVWFLWCGLMAYSIGLAAGGAMGRFGKGESGEGK